MTRISRLSPVLVAFLSLVLAACGAQPATTKPNSTVVVSLGHAVLGAPSTTCDSMNGVWQDWSPRAEEGFDKTDTEIFGSNHGAALGVVQQLSKATLASDSRMGVTQVDFEQVVVTDKPIEGCREFIFSADSAQWTDGVIRVKFSLVGVANGSGPGQVASDKAHSTWIELKEPIGITLQP